MKIRRHTVAGLALLASVNLAAAGCGVPIITGGGSDESPTPSAQEKPAHQVLTESTVDMGITPYTFAMKTGDTIAKGAADPAADHGKVVFTSAEAKAGEGPRLEFLTISDELWVKLDPGPAANARELPKQWMRLDKSKLDDPADTYYAGGDIVGAEEVFAGLLEAKKTGERRYEGKVDLTKVKGTMLADEQWVGQLGSAASSVPFAAQVDEKGRLTSLELKVPAAGGAPAQTWTATYSNYEKPVNLSKPGPGEAVEAPAAVYKILNQ